LAIKRTRRNLLRAIGLTAVAGAAAGVGRYSAGWDTPPPSGRPSPAPLAPRFDLRTPGGALMTQRSLTEPTVMQSFAIDSVNRRLFTAQLVGAGRMFDGEAEPRTAAERADAGDLCITELTIDGWVVSSMYLLGFGHGVQIGVEPDGPDSLLWTEVNSSAVGGVGWGRQVARFRYRAGAVVRPGHPGMRIVDPVPGVTRIAIAVDAIDRQATLRFRLDDEFRLIRTDLDTLLLGDALDLDASIADPRPGTTAQGFATFGPFLYAMEGGIEDDTPAALISTSYISRTEWDTGRTRELTLVTDGSGARNREPEGLGLYQPDPNDPSQVWLCLGVGSGPFGSRRASIYYRTLA
jgi:hypothetical protein